VTERLSNENIAVGIARYLDEAEFYVGHGPDAEEVRTDWLDGWLDGQVVALTNLDDVIIGRYQISVTRVDGQYR
jgi:hypothetical protein